MEKYYIIKPAVGTKETGMAYPAVESYNDYDFDGPRSVHKLKFREFPDFEPDIRFKIAKGAKMVDLLSQATISAHGLLVSGKLKNAIDKLNLAPNKSFPVIIKDHSGTKYEYYWIQFVWENDYEYVDWGKSKFIIKRFSKVEGYISLSSFSEYKIKSLELGKLKLIRYESLGLKNIPFDVFTLPLETNLVCNKNTYEKLMGFTGITLINTSKLFNVTDQDSNHLS